MKASEYNTRGLSNEVIITLVPLADPCKIVLADWDARAVVAEENAHSLIVNLHIRNLEAIVEEIDVEGDIVTVSVN